MARYLLIMFIGITYPIFTHSTRVGRTQRIKTGSRGAVGIMPDLLRDIIMIHRNLLSLTTYQIIVSFFPAYIAARMADERIQSNFYCKDHHKNCHQMPHWCKDAARWGIGIPIAALGSQALFSRDQDMRLTSRIFLTGMPFVIFGKDILKKLKIRACLRPKCELFCPHKNTYGGCPSGHMAEATYMVVLYGLRYGIKYTLPLAALAAFLGATFVTCNRHFTSQIIAGAALGAAYACAAQKVVSSRLHDQLEMSMIMDKKGKPGLYISYRF